MILNSISTEKKIVIYIVSNLIFLDLKRCPVHEIENIIQQEEK